MQTNYRLFPVPEKSPARSPHLRIVNYEFIPSCKTLTLIILSGQNIPKALPIVSPTKIGSYPVGVGGGSTAFIPRSYWQRASMNMVFWQHGQQARFGRFAARLPAYHIQNSLSISFRGINAVFLVFHNPHLPDMSLKNESPLVQNKRTFRISQEQ